MKILLLEDELMLQSSILEYLETLGHKCTVFTNGRDAKDTLKSTTFDLLIMDINVPYISGLELLDAIKKNNCNTSVIFISALVDIETITRAFDLGAADYLKKPFHLKELALRVQKIANDMANTKREHILLSQNYSYIKKENKLLFNNEEQSFNKKATQYSRVSMYEYRKYY